MKCIIRSIVSAATIAGMMFFTGCEWESGSNDNFNASQVVGSSNVSGLYEGQLSGGRAVSRTSNGRITHLNVQQSGKNVTVIDNQGSIYQGTIGDVFTDTDNRNENDDSILERTDTRIQISFEGNDNVAGRQVSFTGIVLIEEGTFVELIPDGEGGFEEFITARRNTQIRGTWIETNGVVAEVLGQAEDSL